MLQFPRKSFTLAFAYACIVFALVDEGIVSGESPAPSNAVQSPPSISAGGMGRYVRGQWSVVAIRATNSGIESSDATLSVFLEDDSRTQFTRRFWLPARSARKMWLPIRPPDDVPAGQGSLRASVLNVVQSGAGVVLHREREGPLISDSLLALDPSELHTGMISRMALPGQLDTPSPRFDEAYETVVEARMLHDGERKIMGFNDHFLPPYVAAYDALDQLVICSDRIAADSGGSAAVRNWIARGGRAWIMLDLAGIDVVQKLLGNATPCEIVDRVELTEFKIETPASASVGAEPTETWRAEEPVEFVRVLIDSADVYSSIDGWPASFSIPFGNGHVLFTTLAARGWRYQYDEFAEPTGPARPTSGPTGALRYLASEFNQQLARQSVLSDKLKPILSEQLGYSVPSRSIAAAILGVNCALIVILGVWLARRERLEQIACVIPVVTAVSAIMLVLIGSANTSSIPATSSILRLANVSAETNEIHADAIAAFYSPDTVALPLQFELSGIAMPAIQDLAGVVKRVAWDDNGQGRWEHIDVASGSVRFARVKESRVLEHPLRARASFGPNGLEGRIIGVGQIGTPADAVIASPPAPNSNVTIDKTGAFQVGSDGILSETEFLSGAMLSDQQQRRQAIYREILTPRQGMTYPQRSTLFVWGDSHSFGFTTPDLFQRTGATLYAIPLDIGHTLPKQPFLIPSTFVRTRNSAASRGASAVYNPRTGRWMKDATHPTQSFFQFILPREVVPCQVLSARIVLRIHAPSRTVELRGLKDNQQVIIETHKNPSGVLTFTIDDPALLALDEDGGLHFGITVSPTETQVAAEAEKNRPNDQNDANRRSDSFEHSGWQIDYLRLQASGETQ